MATTDEGTPAAATYDDAWERAQAGAARLGARIDAPVKDKDGFAARAQWTVKGKTHSVAGHGATAVAALEALVRQLPSPTVHQPHCPTCACTQEVLANG